MLLDSSGVSFGVLGGTICFLLLLMFETQGGVQSENSEKLDFDDLLNENAMFLRSQGFQNETNIVPKLAERRKKNKEEAKREERVP